MGEGNLYLGESALCNFSDENIQKVAAKLRQEVDPELSPEDFERELAVKTFYYVRDNIKFGQPVSYKASDVVQEGIGQCYAKSNLMVALLRSSHIPSRFAFTYITGEALMDITPPRGLIPSRDEVPHPLPEVYLGGRWLRVDCTRDKYSSPDPDRVFKWNGRESTPKHPFLVREGGTYAFLDEITSLHKAPKQRSEIVQMIFKMGLDMFNCYVDSIRFKVSGVRAFSDENLRKMEADAFETGKSIPLNHQGNLKAISFIVSRTLKSSGIKMEVVEKGKHKLHLRSYTPPGNDFRIGEGFLQGLVWRINPQAKMETSIDEKSSSRDIIITLENNKGTSILIYMDMLRFALSLKRELSVLKKRFKVRA
jgi:hypothetical protein